MNLTQESRDLVSKHWGASNMAEKIEALARRYAESPVELLREVVESIEGWGRDWFVESKWNSEGHKSFARALTAAREWCEKSKSVPPSDPNDSDRVDAFKVANAVRPAPIPDTDEALALELLNAWRSSVGKDPVTDMREFDNNGAAWLAVARRARELSDAKVYDALGSISEPLETGDVEALAETLYRVSLGAGAGLAFAMIPFGLLSNRARDGWRRVSRLVSQSRSAPQARREDVDVEGIVAWLLERSATPGADLADVERVIRWRLAKFIRPAIADSPGIVEVQKVDGNGASVYIVWLKFGVQGFQIGPQWDEEEKDGAYFCAEQLRNALRTSVPPTPERSTAREWTDAVDGNTYRLGRDGELAVEHGPRNCHSANYDVIVRRLLALTEVGPPPHGERSARGVTPTFEEVERVYEQMPVVGGWTREIGLRAVMALYEKHTGTAPPVSTQAQEKIANEYEHRRHLRGSEERPAVEGSDGGEDRLPRADGERNEPRAPHAGGRGADQAALQGVRRDERGRGQALASHREDALPRRADGGGAQRDAAGVLLDGGAGRQAGATGLSANPSPSPKCSSAPTEFVAAAKALRAACARDPERAGYWCELWPEKAAFDAALASVDVQAPYTVQRDDTPYPASIGGMAPSSVGEERVREIVEAECDENRQAVVEEMHRLYSAIDARVQSLERGRVLAPGGKIPEHCLAPPLNQQDVPPEPKDAKCACGHKADDHFDEIETAHNRFRRESLQFACAIGDCRCTRTRAEVEAAAVEGREAKCVHEVRGPCSQCGTAFPNLPASSASEGVPSWVPLEHEMSTILIDSGSESVAFTGLSKIRRLIAQRAKDGQRG